MRTLRAEPERPVQRDVVRAGTLASAQIHQPLSTARSREGDRFTAELLDPLVDSDGREWVGRGALVEGRVRRTEASRIAGDRAGLDIEVLGLRDPGYGVIPLEAEVAQAPVSLEPIWGRGFLGSLAGAAAGGGAALAVDDRSGVVVGSAIVGAGIGALAAWFFGRRDAELPAGSVMTLRITSDTRFEEPIDPRRMPVEPSVGARPTDGRKRSEGSDERAADPLKADRLPRAP